MLLLRTTRPLKKRPGFTLLEMAIVLAIVGGLIGALFAAAGITQYRVKVNLATDELNEISQNIQSLYAGQNISYTALGSPPASPADFTTLTSTLIQQGVFPLEMLSPPVATGATPAAGTIANTPWNSLAQVSMVGSPTTPVEIVVRYNGLSAQACSDLVLRNSLPGRGTGLTQIVVTGSVPLTYTSTGGFLPMTSLSATAACSSGTTYTVDWYFKLGS